jgi:hypothetical protein
MSNPSSLKCLAQKVPDHAPEFKPWKGQDLLQILPGKWTLQRYDEKSLVMSGQAEFIKKSSDFLLYREHGHHYLNDQKTVTFVREYLYHVKDNRLVIFFDQSRTRLFLDMPLKANEGHDGLVCYGEHPCGDDLYRSSFYFHNQAYFQITHRVKGRARTMCWTPNIIKSVEWNCFAFQGFS